LGDLLDGAGPREGNPERRIAGERAADVDHGGNHLADRRREGRVTSGGVAKNTRLAPSSTGLSDTGSVSWLTARLLPSISRVDTGRAGARDEPQLADRKGGQEPAREQRSSPTAPVAPDDDHDETTRLHEGHGDSLGMHCRQAPTNPGTEPEESVLGQPALFAMGGQDGLDPIATVELFEFELLELGLFGIGEPTPCHEAFDFSFESLMLVHETLQFGFRLLVQRCSARTASRSSI
jgi:hypothetical protein